MKSVYIHIPFCSDICSYCDFCKFYKNDEWIDKYLSILEQEVIELYKGETINTIYIGGGTPSILDLNQLKKLFKIINIFNKEIDEFTFECNVESITKEKLEYLYNNGVDRLSIGVQSFNDKYLKYLNRHHTKEEVFERIKLAKEIGFNNINIDLIYAIENEKLEELEEDLNIFLELDITHISTYSLIIEPNTKLYIGKTKEIEEELDYEMYNLICSKLKENGYEHYEISNFAKTNYESKHNLVYWNNEEYYGFGISASGYINNVRYTNTKSLNRYLKGEYVSESHKLDKQETIENEFILGLRKIEGINKEKFFKKYNMHINDIEVVKELLKNRKLLENKENVYINPKYIYTSNLVLEEFINFAC